jgi:hypothetical protein
VLCAGQPAVCLRAGQPAPLIVVRHRLLWLVEQRPREIPACLDQARPTLGKSGESALRATGARGAEATTLRKLTTNWRTLIKAHRGTVA